MKKKTLLCVLSTTGSLAATVVGIFSSNTFVVSNRAESAHNWNHYAAVAPTEAKSRTKSFGLAVVVMKFVLQLLVKVLLLGPLIQIFQLLKAVLNSTLYIYQKLKPILKILATQKYQKLVLKLQPMNMSQDMTVSSNLLMLLHYVYLTMA